MGCEFQFSFRGRASSPLLPAQNMASLTKYCPFIVFAHCWSDMMSRSTSCSCSATEPDSVCPQPATQHFVPGGGCSPCGGRQAGAASGFEFSFIKGTLIMQMSFLICRLEYSGWMISSLAVKVCSCGSKQRMSSISIRCIKML